MPWVQPVKKKAISTMHTKARERLIRKCTVILLNSLKVWDHDIIDQLRFIGPIFQTAR